MFQKLGLRHLCVIKRNGCVVGIITRKDLQTFRLHHNAVITRMQAMFRGRLTRIRRKLHDNAVKARESLSQKYYRPLLKPLDGAPDIGAPDSVTDINAIRGARDIYGGMASSSSGDLNDDNDDSSDNVNANDDHANVGDRDRGESACADAVVSTTCSAATTATATTKITTVSATTISTCNPTSEKHTKAD